MCVLWSLLTQVNGQKRTTTESIQQITYHDPFCFPCLSKEKKKALADSANNQFFFLFHDYIGWPIFVNAGGRDSFFFLPRVDDYNVKFVSLSIFFFALVVLSLKATRVELMHSDGPHPASPLFFFCVCVYTYTYQARVNDEYGTHAPYHIYYSFLLLYIMETVMACCSYIESILPNTACRACC